MIPPETRWLNDPDAQAVCRALQVDGHDVFFVGGCVRNALLGVFESDVDMSTNARPEQVIGLAQAAGLKAVPTGIDHGTITVVSGGIPFEVTTFRRDVETDGRRAVVAFSDDISDDARRRDFTMNALYATPDGKVIDPLGGLADLQAGRVRFIENATARIREDYLRILRYFRFMAYYGDPVLGFDAETLGAIAQNLDGLETLSVERVGQEMQKLLSAPDPAAALATMRQTGVLAAILPGSDDGMIAVMVHMQSELGLAPCWLCRLAALGGADVPHRLRLSKAHAKRLAILTDVGFSGASLAEIAYRHGADIARCACLLRGALAESLPNRAMLETISAASEARFPVVAKDLMPDLQGPALGARLAQLEDRWIASGFTLSRADLLGQP